MPTPAQYDVFLSAVSKELGSYRSKVAHVLRRKGLHVCVQEDFSQGGDTLLLRLASYIERCEAVVLLVGERCGGWPTDEHAASLGDIARPEYERYRAYTGQATLSYTQWEYLLAKHYQRPTYVYFTAEGFQPNEPNPESEANRQHQQAYCAWLRHLGEHTEALTTEAQLVEDVLVQPFPDLTEKPRKLPYGTLGKLFMGREPLMRELRAALGNGPQPGRPAAAALTTAAATAMHGLGGIGKTRTAVEYAHRYGHEYTALLFVAADSPEKLKESLAELCGVLQLSQLAGTTQEAQIAGAMGWLRRNPGWLVILDNVDDEPAAEAADALLSELSAAGQFIITSRLLSFSPEVTPLKLGVLLEADALGILLARTDHGREKTSDEAAVAQRLARKLDGLALALEQAAAYIIANGLSLAEYEEAWETNHREVLKWEKKRLTHYHSSVATTWLTSFRHLSPDARTLLNRLAWLAPDPIPKALLKVPVPEAARTRIGWWRSFCTLLKMPVPEAAPIQVQAAMAELGNYSLVTFAQDKAAFTVHRLVQDVTRQRLKEAQQVDACLLEALNWVDAAFVGDPNDVRTWSVLDPLLPHALAITAIEYTEPLGNPEPTSRLLNDAGQLMDAKAQFAEAESLMRRALAIGEANFGPNHPKVATRLNNLAQLLQATNRLDQAEPLIRRALAIDEASLGPNHPDVAVDLNNLALLLKTTSRLDQAEPLMRRVVNIFEQSLGLNYPQVATALSNLAQLLQATNRLDQAEPLMRRALAINEASFGPNHPDVAVCLSNLAHLLEDTNRLDQAEPLTRRALAIDEASFGPNHPKVAIRLNNLASLLLATNRLDQAEPLMRRALAIDEASFGPIHPEVAIDLNNLASLLQTTNRLDQAEPLMRRAFLIFFNSLGWKHPNTQTLYGNYTALLMELGQTEEHAIATIQLLRNQAGPSAQ